MRRLLLSAIASTVLLAGCGSKQPAPEPGAGNTGGDGLPVDEPDPAAGMPEMTEAECNAAGGTARWDIGDGNVQCEPGEEQIARIPVGIEGGICCRPAPAAE